MILSNVSFGIFAFLPQGWLFMAFVILIESFIMSKLLYRSNLDSKVTLFVFLSNAISGIIGIITTLILTGGWFLVVWFPWVSSHEVDLTNSSNYLFMGLFYFVCFVVTLILESLTNWLFLRKQHPAKKILKSTFIANIISYIIGSIVLYAYSFSSLYL